MQVVAKLTQVVVIRGGTRTVTVKGVSGFGPACVRWVEMRLSRNCSGTNVRLDTAPIDLERD